MSSILSQTADEIARTAANLVRSGRILSIDVAVQMAMEAYCADGRAPEISRGLGGLISTTSDFNKLNVAQNHAIALQAQISGIGQEAWDSAVENYGDAIESAGWIPALDYTYDKMMAFWLAQTKRILVYGSAWLEHRPTTEDVADVERLASGTEDLIGVLRSYIPSAAMAQGAADRGQAQAALANSSMRSPDDVMQATLKEEVLNRVNNLASGTSTILWGAGILAMALVLSKMGGRS